MHECTAKSYSFIKTGYVSYVRIDHYTLTNMTASSAITNSFMQMSWFNPSQQLSTTQPLTHSPPTQWDGGENQEKK